MKVTDKQFEDCQAILNIEADDDEIEKAIDGAYKHAASHAEIPGFRKGKAPRVVLEKHIGIEKIQAEADERLAGELCQRAIESEKIDYYWRPMVEIITRQPFVIKASIALPPKVELGEYHDLKLKKAKVKVTSKQVDETIESFRKQFATWSPVERPVKAGDMVAVDIESNVDGKPFIKETGANYQVEPEKPSNLKGLAEGLIGMNSGEEKSLVITLPADYPEAELAGKEASFQVKVLDVKQVELPPLDDELAKKMAPGMETLDALKERIKDSLEQRETARINDEFGMSLLDKLVEKSSIEYPPVLLENEIQRMIEGQVRQWQMYSRSKEEFEEKLKQNSYESLQERYSQPARERLKRSLVLSQFANQEQIKLSEDELKAEMDRIASRSGSRNEETLKMLNTPESRKSIASEIIANKVFARLIEIADKTTSKKDGTKEPKNKTEKPEIKSTAKIKNNKKGKEQIKEGNDE